MPEYQDCDTVNEMTLLTRLGMKMELKVLTIIDDNNNYHKN